MPDIKQVLNDEIRRLARKEVKNSLLPLMKQLADQKRLIAELKKQLAEISKKTPAEAAPKKLIQIDADEPKKLRLNAEGIVRLRTKKLGISQSKLAELVGVSGHTVSLWEKGEVSPRANAKALLCSLRTVGKKELKRRLAELDAAEENK